MATAQNLEIGPDGTAEVTGAIGDPKCTTGPVTVVGDVDFYVFRGRKGDEVMIDIDGGMKPQFSGLRSVDTIVAIFLVDPKTATSKILATTTMDRSAVP
jgi:hypothetical protein